jgi:hypothetical protein
MTKITRQTIFAQASCKLRQDFEELSTVPHNALKGAQAEKLVRLFLQAHLPKRFDVGAGFIIDPLDQVSKQTDVIVYDALNCPVYRASEDAAIFPSNNVAAVVEVKSRLDKNELESAFKNILEAKRLAKTPPPPFPIMMTSQTLGCLFAFRSTISLDKISEHYEELVRHYGIGDHIDMVIVLDQGTLSVHSKPQNRPWGMYFHEGKGGQMAEGMHFAAVVDELGVDSLDAFLRFLLTQLTFFRGIVDHPGFDWTVNGPYPPLRRRFLCTVCTETDPVLRAAKAKEYEQQVREEFMRHEHD